MQSKEFSRVSVEDIIARVLQDGKLFFDKDFPYLKNELYYQQLSDDEAKRYIVGLLAEAEKIATPKTDYQETLDRLRLLECLQLHLSEKLKDQQHLVSVRNGVFNAKNCDRSGRKARGMQQAVRENRKRVLKAQLYRAKDQHLP